MVFCSASCSASRYPSFIPFPGPHVALIPNVFEPQSIECLRGLRMLARDWLGWCEEVSCSHDPTNYPLISALRHLLQRGPLSPCTALLFSLRAPSV